MPVVYHCRLELLGNILFAVVFERRNTTTLHQSSAKWLSSEEKIEFEVIQRLFPKLKGDKSIEWSIVLLIYLFSLDTTEQLSVFDWWLFRYYVRLPQDLQGVSSSLNVTNLSYIISNGILLYAADVKWKKQQQTFIAVCQSIINNNIKV